MVLIVPQCNTALHLQLTGILYHTRRSHFFVANGVNLVVIHLFSLIAGKSLSSIILYEKNTFEYFLLKNVCRQERKDGSICQSQNKERNIPAHDGVLSCIPRDYLGDPGSVDAPLMGLDLFKIIGTKFECLMDQIYRCNPNVAGPKFRAEMCLPKFG
jgi:hypothetical protein